MPPGAAARALTNIAFTSTTSCDLQKAIISAQSDTMLTISKEFIKGAIRRLETTNCSGKKHLGPLAF